MRRAIIVISSIWIATATPIFAQDTHAGYGAHRGGTGPRDTSAHKMVLSEPGQGAFAALAEVVQVLETDPKTDWTKVDLTGLRAHLVDMDLLVTHAIVTETPLHNGVMAVATGDARTRAALTRMVPAHARQLAADTRWKIETRATEDGIALQATSDDPQVVARIKGLGFFGLMASQDHHRTHHLSMARGQSLHGH